MQIHFYEKLNNARFGKRMIEFCKKHNETKLPKIDIVGKFERHEILEHQVRTFNDHLAEQAIELKKLVFDTIKPLQHMSNMDIKNIICFWILSDEKFISNAKEIVRVIKQKNIDGLSLEENKKKQVDIKIYLQSIIGEFIGLEMLEKLSDILSTEELSDMDCDKLARYIVETPVNCIKDQLIDDIGDEIDGEWIINNMDNNKFVDNLEMISALNKEDAQQIYILIRKFNVCDNDIIIR
eukprot:145869_1